MESSGLAERIFIGISFGIEFVISVLFGLMIPPYKVHFMQIFYLILHKI